VSQEFFHFSVFFFVIFSPRAEAYLGKYFVLVVFNSIEVFLLGKNRLYVPESVFYLVKFIIADGYGIDAVQERVIYTLYLGDEGPVFLSLDEEHQVDHRDAHIGDDLFIILLAVHEALMLIVVRVHVYGIPKFLTEQHTVDAVALGIVHFCIAKVGSTLDVLFGSHSAKSVYPAGYVGVAPYRAAASGMYLIFAVDSFCAVAFASPPCVRGRICQRILHAFQRYPVSYRTPTGCYSPAR